MSGVDADGLVRQLAEELAPTAQPNRFVDLLAAGRVPRERLAWLVAEERQIVASDRRSFTVVAARFPDPPVGDLYRGLAGGESLALDLLGRLAVALGADPTARAYQPRPLAQAYCHYVAWCALNATRSELTLAMLANLGYWGSYCAATAHALRAKYGMAEDDVSFFTFFAQPPPGFQEQALAVIQTGLDLGEDPDAALRAGRLMQAYELSFWDTLAAGLD